MIQTEQLMAFSKLIRWDYVNWIELIIELIELNVWNNFWWTFIALIDSKPKSKSNNEVNSCWWGWYWSESIRRDILFCSVLSFFVSLFLLVFSSDVLILEWINRLEKAGNASLSNPYLTFSLATLYKYMLLADSMASVDIWKSIDQVLGDRFQ